jgi:hypothetical protein
MNSYPIWIKIQSCIYNAIKSYGIKDDGCSEVLIGTSASNSHSFVKTRITHKKHEDNTRTYHFYVDDKLIKTATLKDKDIDIIDLKKNAVDTLLVAVEYYEMNHDTGEEESTERNKADVWKAYDSL